MNRFNMNDDPGRSGWERQGHGRPGRSPRGGGGGGPREGRRDWRGPRRGMRGDWWADPGALFGQWEGSRRRRGDVRTAVLEVLTEQDAHGYQIIQEIESRTEGAWKPSPGSVYPLLQLLEDEGLVTSTGSEGKRVYSITDQGRAEAAERAEAAGGSVWDQRPTGSNVPKQAALLLSAARQVLSAGTDTQREKAAEILADARKELYKLLAES